ncbi:AMINO ACID-LIGASE [Salix koriyanagi]|uniref:AMINO ACID-LIGASE n=1 Tax=Salix koriyanagi TaxID=2511006 RepID=A0A9Q0TG35_9ROSI|nr:AMINO ACID-LIGASE [Salix koriyanagi]
MSSSGSSNKPRTVRLRCPSVSSTVSFFAWDDQRLDLGSIARTFGLDPSTLKLNGYFISRGVDLVSSSVTWRSLLSFFTARGLSTGKDDREALIVDGNLSKVGTKPHDPQSASSRSNYRAEVEGIGVSIGGQQHQDINFLMNKRMKESNSENKKLKGVAVALTLLKICLQDAIKVIRCQNGVALASRGSGQ